MGDDLIIVVEKNCLEENMRLFCYAVHVLGSVEDSSTLNILGELIHSILHGLVITSSSNSMLYPMSI